MHGLEIRVVRNIACGTTVVLGVLESEVRSRVDAKFPNEQLASAQAKKRSGFQKSPHLSLAHGFTVCHGTADPSSNALW